MKPTCANCAHYDRRGMKPDPCPYCGQERKPKPLPPGVGKCYACPPPRVRMDDDHCEKWTNVGGEGTGDREQGPDPSPITQHPSPTPKGDIDGQNMPASSVGE